MLSRLAAASFALFILILGISFYGDNCGDIHQPMDGDRTVWKLPKGQVLLGVQCPVKYVCIVTKRDVPGEYEVYVREVKEGNSIIIKENKDAS